MALALNRLGASALRGAYRIRPRRLEKPSRFSFRPFHPTCSRRNDESKNSPPPDTPTQPLAASSQSTGVNTPKPADTSEQGASEAAAPTAVSSSEEQQPEFREASEWATPEEEAKMQQLLDEPPEDLKAEVEAYKAEVARLQKEFMRQLDIETRGEPDVQPRENAANKSRNQSFMAMGEDEDEADIPDEPFLGDDIPSLGHGELEQHREMREYARIAAWEMPLLSKFAKPYEPPKNAPLRFRYTNYMGETHPSENKVVLEFCTADLPIDPKQRLKLVKLLGVRYDPQKDLAKMSCEMFPNIAQNKRYLGDLVDTLIATAKGEGDMEGAKDTFEDVPVDFRHVKWKQPPQFPEEWKMTEERQKQLTENRRQRAVDEAQRGADGLIVNGENIIETALRAPAAVNQSQRPKPVAGGRRKTQRL